MFFSLAGFAGQALRSKEAAGCAWKGRAWSLRAGEEAEPQGVNKFSWKRGGSKHGQGFFFPNLLFFFFPAMNPVCFKEWLPAAQKKSPKQRSSTEHA